MGSKNMDVFSLRDSIVFFSTPVMVAEQHIPVGKRFRLRPAAIRI